MESSTSALPTERELQNALQHVLGSSRVTIIARRENPYRGAFPSERVTCATVPGKQLNVFVKYGRRETHSGHGYWGSVEHEAWVYRALLPRTGLNHACCFGAYRHPHNGHTWLMLTALDPSEQLYRGQSTREEAVDTLGAVVAWIAAFHTRLAQPFTETQVRALPRYDRAFFKGWAQRTRAFSQPMHREFPWLPSLLEDIEPEVESLAGGDECVIHGELYPSNVLVSRGRIWPVDWQSAAIGRGEIDLASLLEGWEGTQVYDQMVAEYVRLRWGGDSPHDFEARVRLASLYWPLRWLGDEPSWTVHPRRRPYVARLRAAWDRYVTGS